jgi:hypothetical protein
MYTINPEAALSPVEIAQGQLDAYNARDIDQFARYFSDTVKSYRMPSLTPIINGKDELIAFYQSERFVHANLHAQLLDRIVLGNKIFDHERITGLSPEPMEVVAVFEVVDGLIETIWGFS